MLLISYQRWSLLVYLRCDPFIDWVLRSESSGLLFATLCLFALYLISLSILWFMVRRCDWFFFHDEMVMNRRCFSLRNMQPRIILCWLFHCQRWYWFILYGFAFSSMSLVHWAIYFFLALLMAVELCFPFIFTMMQISLVVLALFRDKVSNIIINVLIILVLFKVLAFLW